MSPEELFRQGVEAMRGHICAYLVSNGHAQLGANILAISAPAFQLAEKFAVGKDDEKV